MCCTWYSLFNEVYINVKQYIFICICPTEFLITVQYKIGVGDMTKILYHDMSNFIS